MQSAAAGTLDVGVETYKADKISKVSEQTVYTDPRSGAETKHVHLNVQNRNHPVDFDATLAGRNKTNGKKPDTFVQNERSGRVFAVTDAGSRTDADGRVTEQVRLTSPIDYQFLERGALNRDNWKKLTIEQARPLWDKQVADTPEFRSSDMHLITGAVLPIWDRLGGSPKIYRLQTDQGDRMLGRVIPATQVDATLRRLGAEGIKVTETPAQVADRVGQGAVATLANGWTIKPARVAGENRLELVGPDYRHNEELNRHGIFSERIDYQTRFFIPTEPGAAARAIEAITRNRPITSLSDEGGPKFSPRRKGIPADAAAITTFRSADDLKKHPDYREAKAGDVAAAARLVGDLVRPAQVERARLMFGRDALFVPVMAEEATGHNAIPGMLARFYAEATGGDVASGVVQRNRAFHTGADAMERFLVRPEFEGQIEAGRNYVLVDDVSVLGGTLAELANHIQANGGKVVGVVTLANASRSGKYAPKRTHVSLIEGRFGDEVRDRFGVEPGALTADEAQYLANFRDADTLRARRAKAEGERNRRLREKGLLPSEAEEGGVKPTDGEEPRFSPRSPDNPERKYTAGQRQAIDNAFAKEPTTRKKIAEAREDAGRKFVRTVLDPYIGLKRDDPEAYMAARLANSSAGAFHYFLEQGPLKFTGNALDADAKLQNGGINALRRDLGDEQGDFMRWVVGNRAERLKAEDRENLLKDVDIAGLKSLNKGQLAEDYVLSNGKTTRSREAAYLDALKRLDAANRNVMEMAVEAGLVKRDKADALIANPFYVPFYRAAADERTRSFAGASLSPGLVRQYAFKQLRGGREKLRDPWENALGNWEHMIDAAMRNRTAVRILEEASTRGLGAVEAVPAQAYHNMTKAEKAKTVWAMKEGKKVYYRVDDPMMLTAVSALNTASSNGFFMRLGRGFAKTLRYGVTANPLFALPDRHGFRVPAAFHPARLRHRAIRSLASGWTGPADRGMRLLYRCRFRVLVEPASSVVGPDLQALLVGSRRPCVHWRAGMEQPASGTPRPAARGPTLQPLV